MKAEVGVLSPHFASKYRRSHEGVKIPSRGNKNFPEKLWMQKLNANLHKYKKSPIFVAEIIIKTKDYGTTD